MNDLLARRTTHFLVWRPATNAPPPVLVIGEFAYGNPPKLAGEKRLPLQAVPGFTDLFAVAAATAGLVDDHTYHYWFEVSETAPDRPRDSRVLVTDPFATTVDWRLRSPLLLFRQSRCR